MGNDGITIIRHPIPHELNNNNRTRTFRGEHGGITPVVTNTNNDSKYCRRNLEYVICKFHLRHPPIVVVVQTSHLTVVAQTSHLTVFTFTLKGQERLCRSLTQF